MKSLSLICATAFAALAPLAAFAQDWSGAYGALTVSKASGDVLAPAPFDLEGNSYGLAIGYNVQNGALVYGGEIAYHDAEIDFVSIIPFSQRYEQMFDFKGRIGYASGSFMAYGILGYSTNKYVLNGSATSTGGGFSYGLGVDYAVSDRVFVGAEYLRRDMKNDAVTSINALDADISTLSLRLGMSF